MVKAETVSLEAVRITLSRDDRSSVVNHGGWCVFVNGDGRHFYVIDDDSLSPVPFQRVNSLNISRRSIKLKSFSIV